MLYRAICECGCEQFMLERDDNNNKVHIKCNYCGTEFATVSSYDFIAPESGEQHEDDKDSD